MGRAEFTSENRSVLTHLREDGDLLHLYLYHFLYETGEPVEVEVALPGVGAVHRIDGWTGAVRPHSGVRQDGERTIVTVTLAPGETALLTLDRSAAAAPASTPAAPETVAELPEWTIAVESWDAGELRAHHRGPRTRLPDPRGPPDDGGHPDRGRDRVAAPVEGHPRGRARGLRRRRVHHHACSSTTDPQEGYRYVLDLGSTAGGLGSLRVNDGEAKGFDTSSPVVDVTEDLRPGDNTVTIRVASSLNNRLLARGYYEQVPDIVTRAGRDWNPGCKPPRCTITACSVRCGSCAKRQASEPGTRLLAAGDLCARAPSAWRSALGYGTDHQLVDADVRRRLQDEQHRSRHVVRASALPRGPPRRGPEAAGRGSRCPPRPGKGGRPGCRAAPPVR